MTLTRYSAYKGSGITWLGTIPSHWRIGKFRYIFRESSEVNGAKPVGEMLSVSGYRGVEVKVYDDENRKRNDADLEMYRVVRPGQLAVNTMWLNYGGLGVSEFTGHMSPAYRAYDVMDDVHGRYIHHLMRCSIYVTAYTGNLTGIRPNSLQMSRATLMEWPVLLPPIEEQRKIANYLDAQTVKIDALIRKQERLIETLAERRRAVISHAVTRGLDPNAPTKETGSAWFPSIPASWVLVPAASASILIQTGPFGSQLHADEYVAGGTPVINPSHIIDGQIAPNESVTVHEERARELVRHQLRVGDIVVARRGEMGRCAVVGSASAGFLCGTGSLIVRLRSEAYVAAYFQLIFSSDANRAALTERSIGATMDNLNGEIVARLRLPRPSIYEQQEIIEYLNHETAQIDALSAKAREMIDILKERRQALISAAVTGKIDVRGLS